MGLIQLPITLPLYKSCKINFCPGIVLEGNPTFKFWYCNHTIFLRGLFQHNRLINLTLNHATLDNISSLVEKDSIPKIFLNQFVRQTICSALNAGYYVFANGCADLFYMGEDEHSLQDCLISGYNNYSEQYTISCYNFKEHTKAVPYTKFEKAINNDACKYLLILKPNYVYENFNTDLILQDLKIYLSHSSIPESGETLLGIDLYDIMADTIKNNCFNDRLYDLFYEHKICMQYRIKMLEKVFDRDNTISQSYQELIKDLNPKEEILLAAKFKEETLLKTLLSGNNLSEM